VLCVGWIIHRYRLRSVHRQHIAIPDVPSVSKVALGGQFGVFALIGSVLGRTVGCKDCVAADSSDSPRDGSALDTNSGSVALRPI
jgi:hypothetical protein